MTDINNINWNPTKRQTLITKLIKPQGVYLIVSTKVSGQGACFYSEGEIAMSKPTSKLQLKRGKLQLKRINSNNKLMSNSNMAPLIMQ